MKKIPKGDYTERLEAIYDVLHFDADERFFADIVFSNFVCVTDEVDSIFDCGHDPHEFHQMMKILSQFDDFMELLKENEGDKTFELLNDILALKTNLRHDFFEDVWRIIYVEDPLMKSDVDKLQSFDEEISKIGQKEVWYNYLKLIGIFEDYLNTLNSNPQN
jgi:hypothetical protein